MALCAQETEQGKEVEDYRGFVDEHVERGGKKDDAAAAAYVLTEDQNPMSFHIRHSRPNKIGGGRKWRSRRASLEQAPGARGKGPSGCSTSLSLR